MRGQERILGDGIVEKAMEQAATLYLLDDDAGFRASMHALADSLKLNLESFASLQELLDSGPAKRPACTVIDHRLEDGHVGLDAIGVMIEHGWRIPAIICTAYASVPLAVQYMKRGVRAFLEKPLQGRQIAVQIEEALEHDRKLLACEHLYRTLRDDFDRLTTRQKAILGYLCQGLVFKKIAEELDLSRRMIDLEKAALYRIIRVHSPIELGLWISKFVTLHLSLGHSVSDLDFCHFDFDLESLSVSEVSFSRT